MTNNYKLNSNPKIVPVILSGGSGSRLWPLSKPEFPKQYLNFDENNKYSLLQNTIKRLNGLKNLDNPLIICNEEQRFIVDDQMNELDIQPKSILLEPFGRNTAAAIALAANFVLKPESDPLLLILSSDHLVKDKDKFHSSLEIGIALANTGKLVTLGIKPTYPETGYGYIESYSKLSEKNKSSDVKRFVEKPSLEDAKILIKNKCFSWNSGIFIFKSSVILNELKKFQPQIFEVCENIILKKDNQFNFYFLNKEVFHNCPNIPIDIAVLEKTTLGSVVSLDAGWSDIGNWKSVKDNSQKDSFGNHLRGKVVVQNTKNCYLRSEGRKIIGLGLENLVIVETRDALLVVNEDHSQNIKPILHELKNENTEEKQINIKKYRPWGNFTTIEELKTWKVKKLEIKPKASLSLQRHSHRSEHWVVVSGEAQVELDNKVTYLKENESIYIPKKSKHRLSNPGAKLLVIIEVQSGDYLGEDDIERFADNYGREIK